MANRLNEQSQDTPPTTSWSNINDRSLTLTSSHSYEYITIQPIGYRVNQEQNQVEDHHGQQLEESTESSGIYYSIEYTQTRRNPRVQIKPAISERDQLPSSFIATQSCTSKSIVDISEHYETMENVLLQCHTKITII